MRPRRGGVVAALLAACCCAAQGAAPCSGQLPETARVAGMDERTRTSDAYEAEQELREFALFSYRNLANDIVNGYGPFLDAAGSQFVFACGDAAARIAWLRALLADSATAADFARRLAVAHDLARRSAVSAAP